MHESKLQTWQKAGRERGESVQDLRSFKTPEPRKEEGIEEIAGK